MTAGWYMISNSTMPVRSTIARSTRPPERFISYDYKNFSAPVSSGGGGISEEKARSIAQRAPQAQIVSCKLSREDGQLVYEIEMREGGGSSMNVRSVRRTARSSNGNRTRTINGGTVPIDEGKGQRQKRGGRSNLCSAHPFCLPFTGSRNIPSWKRRSPLRGYPAGVFPNGR